MGNEVAIIDRQPVVPSFTMSDMERIATSIAKGGMFGSKDPHAVLTLCMLAQAEGQHPAVVFRDYDIIQGKPAKKAEAMLRDFINAGGRVTWNRLDDECADATFSHPQGGTVTINWTLARAQKAGLGGKDMWKKYPRQMLRSRVVSEGVRTVCPNATSGLYVPEEVRDFDNGLPTDTPATPEPKRARDLKAKEPEQIEAQEPDYSATLVELEAVAGPGQTDALAEAWKEIGKEARKALADELPRLKSLCEPVPDTDAPAKPATPELRTVLRSIEDARTLADVDRIDRESEPHRAFLSEADCDRLDETLALRRSELQGEAVQ